MSNSVQNQPIPGDIKAVCIVAIVLVSLTYFFFVCLYLRHSIFYCCATRKAAKQARSVQAERLTRDLEAQRQADEQASQLPPRPQAGDFSGFDFASNPYIGAQVTPQPTTLTVLPQYTVPPPVPEPVHSAGQVEHSAIGTATTTPEQLERFNTPAASPKTGGRVWPFLGDMNEDDLELHEINIHDIHSNKYQA
ncbi:hypothetical protein F4774DRAFT_189940 [Daldinia eschscholtzii]|nr:hypothetical protein F4774DRAFT_189940 [Daldinia eschscholtzii]